jgi:ketosteroid isomerase-like protein
MSKKFMLCLMVAVVTMGSVAMAAHHEGGFDEMAATWEAAYNKGDVAAVAAMYADDGMRMPPDMPMVKGRAAIQEQIQAGLDRGMVQVKIAVDDSHTSGEMGHARGTFVGMDAEGNKIAVGKWANVAKMVDGQWQIVYDIFNYDAPMPAGE